MCVCVREGQTDRETERGGVVRHEVEMVIAVSGSADIKCFLPLELTMNARCYYWPA